MTKRTSTRTKKKKKKMVFMDYTSINEFKQKRCPINYHFFVKAKTKNPKS